MCMVFNHYDIMIVIHVCLLLIGLSHILDMFTLQHWHRGKKKCFCFQVGWEKTPSRKKQLR